MNRIGKFVAPVAGATALGAALLVPALAGGAQSTPASVTVVHGIPSVGNVDVCVGATPLLTDVPFGGVATIDVPEGTYDLAVKVADPTACSGATAITLDDAAIPAGANISVVANLTGGSPNLAVYPNDVSPVDPGEGRVAVYHAANAPTVDVRVNGGPGLSGLAQRAVAGADLPATTYDFAVTPAGDPGTVVLALDDVAVPDGQLLQVFAVGAVAATNDANPFQVIVNVVDLPVTQPPASSTTTAAPTSTAPPATTPPPRPTTAQPAFTG